MTIKILTSLPAVVSVVTLGMTTMPLHSRELPAVDFNGTILSASNHKKYSHKKEDQAREWVDLFESEPLDSFRKPTAKWAEFGKVFLDPNKARSLATESGKGIIYNGGKTRNILTNMEHGDAEVQIEFMVPEGSNSGVYFQGRYEIQVFDSWGVKEPKHSDCGGIYQRWVNKQGFDGHPPGVNASRKPGEWQTFEVIFKAPRFDAEGKKIANAKFVKVVHNGVVVHENVELTGSTRSAAFTDEKTLGPIMLQGNHGPVAYRNFKIKHLEPAGEQHP